MLRFPVAALVAVAVVGWAAPAVAAPAPDEDAVRTVLNRMNTSYNGMDFGGFAANLCPDMLQSAGFAANWYASRKTDGPTKITVNSVSVRGDRAVANVRFEAANRDDPKTLDIDLIRNGGEWKACRYNPGRAV